MPAPPAAPRAPIPAGPPRNQPRSTITVKARTRAAPQRGANPLVAPGLRANNPLLNPNTPLSGKALYQAARGLASAEYGPTLSQLRSQIAQNNRQAQGAVKLTGGYYNQLEPFVQQGVQDEGQIASGLNSTLQGIGQNTQTQLGQLGQGALSSLLKYAPQGDGGIANAATSDLAAQIARQQGLAAQQSAITQQFGAQQGANYSGMAASQLGTFGLQGQETLGQIAKAGQVKNEPLAAKVADYLGREGQLTSTDLAKLRSAQTTENIAQAGLGIRQQTANTEAQRNRITAANDAARNRITAANDAARNAITRWNDAANQAGRAAALNEKAGNDAATQAYRQAALNLKAATSGNKAGARPLTTYENNRLMGYLGEMTTLIPAAQKKGEKAPTIKQALALGKVQKGFPAQSPVLIEAAYELLGWGHITPATARAMHAMGMRGGTFNGQPIRVAPPGPLPAGPNPLMPSAAAPPSLVAGANPFGS